MRPLLAAYISVVILLGLAVCGVDAALLARDLAAGPGDLADRAVWLALLLLVSHFPISTPGGAVSTLNSALNYCLILSFGPQFAGPAVALNSLYLNFVRRRASWYKVLFNAAQVLLAVNAAGGLYLLAGGVTHRPPDFHDPLSYLLLLIPFVGFLAVNLLLVSVAVRLERGTPLGTQMRASHYFDLGGNSILFYLGALLSYLYMQLGWLGVGLATVPLVWVHTYLRRYNELKALHRQLDDSHQTLTRQSGELQGKNRDLEEANAQLQRVNEDLQRTRRTLVQAEKLKAMGQMAGGVAHDFNNILGAILARTELLKLEELPPRVEEGLRSILRSALDGATVVRRIQDFTRVTEERDFEPVDLGELVDDVLDMTRAVWRDKAHRLGVTYEVERSLEPRVRVLGNAAELREVIHNLLINALDAMPSGGRLGLAVHAEERQAELEVRDSGHGMPPEVLERAFDPFFTTKGARGNGLGLSVSYGIVERHGGEISASSSPGEGSRFRVRLPLADPALPEPARPEGAELKPSARPLRILAVDDEPDVRSVLVDALRLMGHHVDEAASGQEALESWLNRRQPFVFTDLGMPGMNGWELIDRIRLVAGPEPPTFVLVTGWGAQIRDEDRLAHGVERVLAKPFKIRQLGQLLLQLENGEAGPGPAGF
jgi:signal transduction histidine kinase/ActR/RegA family two-component response regulator